MSNHNYSQYSNNKKHKNPNNYNHHNNVQATKAEPVIPTPAVEPVAEAVTPVMAPVVPMVETVETVALPKTVEGVVIGCAKLNVRTKPSVTSDVVCVLDAMSELEVDVEKSTNEWFHVCTATGVEGYCMRRFVEARL